MKTLRVNDLLIVEYNEIPNFICDANIVISNGVAFEIQDNHEFICKGSEALERFPNIKETIESQGYYWGENPVKHPNDFEVAPDSLGWWIEQEESYLKAEQKTFNLEQTLIFKIV